MTYSNEDRDKAADAWYFDLKEMADRIEINDRRHLRARHRQNVIFFFVVFAFVLLAWRSEINADKIFKNGMLISKQQQLFEEQRVRSCVGSLVIIQKYNALQDTQIQLEMNNKFIDDNLRKQRIAAYRAAKVTPLPTCENLLGTR